MTSGDHGHLALTLGAFWPGLREPSAHDDKATNALVRTFGHHLSDTLRRDGDHRDVDRSLDGID